MRFEPEASDPNNMGLDRARALLEPIKQAVPLISYADLWQLAAVLSIEIIGGPKIPFRARRLTILNSVGVLEGRVGNRGWGKTLDLIIASFRRKSRHLADKSTLQLTPRRVGRYPGCGAVVGK